VLLSIPEEVTTTCTLQKFLSAVTVGGRSVGRFGGVLHQHVALTHIPLNATTVYRDTLQH
jgi:hypothetical protein